MEFKGLHLLQQKTGGLQRRHGGKMSVWMEKHKERVRDVSITLISLGI